MTEKIRSEARKEEYLGGDMERALGQYTLEEMLQELDESAAACCLLDSHEVMTNADWHFLVMGLGRLLDVKFPNLRAKLAEALGREDDIKTFKQAKKDHDVDAVLEVYKCLFLMLTKLIQEEVKAEISSRAGSHAAAGQEEEEKKERRGGEE